MREREKREIEWETRKIWELVENNTGSNSLIIRVTWSMSRATALKITVNFNLSVSSLPLKWKDNFPPPLLYKTVLSKALDPRKTRCPTFSEIDHHNLSNFTPIIHQVCVREFRTTSFWSKPEKRPGSDGIWTDSPSEKTQVFAVANWSDLSVSKIVLCHICCCQSITRILVISVWSWSISQLLETTFSMISWVDSGRTQILGIIPKMNCSLKGAGRKYSHCNRTHIEKFHFVSRTETISPSHVRENLLKMRDVGSRYMEIVWTNFVSTFAEWVSSYSVDFHGNSGVRGSFSAATSLLVLSSRIASFCHIWEIEAASWLCSLAANPPVLLESDWQSALSIPGPFRRNWTLQSQHQRPGSTSALTLPQSYLLFFSSCILFRHRFRAAGGTEILSAANKNEKADVKHMEKIIPLITCEFSLSICLRVGVWCRRFWFESLDPG